ncbi:hypothetical protein ACRYK2_07750 [Escherichia coli]
MKKTFTFSLLAIVFASLLSACVPHHHHRHSDGPRGPAPSDKAMPPSMVDQITAVMVAIN